MIAFLVYIMIWILIGLSMFIDVSNRSINYQFLTFAGMFILMPFIAYVCGI